MIVDWTAPKKLVIALRFSLISKERAKSSSRSLLHPLTFCTCFLFVCRLEQIVYNSLIGTNSLQAALSSFHSGKYLYQQLLLSYQVVSKMSIWVRLVVHLRLWLISPGVAVETLTSVFLSISPYWSPLKI